MNFNSSKYCNNIENYVAVIIIVTILYDNERFIKVYILKLQFFLFLDTTQRGVTGGELN